MHTGTNGFFCACCECQTGAAGWNLYQVDIANALINRAIYVDCSQWIELTRLLAIRL